ncbi:MAG: Aminodeoxychorismate synthase component 2 [Bacteroidota bacterium]
MKVLLIDFYDSFTYNLAHYLEGFALELHVCLYDQIHQETLPDYDVFILSPGPGLPAEKAGLADFLKVYVGVKPILGVCLGMQALVEYLGGELQNQQQVKHGMQETISIVHHNGLFAGLPAEIEVGLYHSWKVNCPTSWISAWSKSQVPMAIELPERRVFGVQFHPESVMTPTGKQLLSNFIHLCKS